MLGPPASIFTADIDEDQILDRIEYRVPRQIMIRPADSQTWMSEFEIDASSGVLLALERHANKWYLKVTNKNTEHLWYELPSGRLALKFDQGLQSTTIAETPYPRLLSHRAGTLLVGSTPEAVICVEVNLSETSTSSPQPNSLPVAMISADVDPRYRK